jgi:hypothetical protein
LYFKVLLKMKTTENYLAEIKEIRKMMEESSRFLSLSGLSGVLVGVYALGCFFGESIIYHKPNLAGCLAENILLICWLLQSFGFGHFTNDVIWLTLAKPKKPVKKSGIPVQG